MTNPVYCDDCNAAVRLERDSNRSLKAKCACETVRNVRVAQLLPDGWSE